MTYVWARLVPLAAIVLYGTFVALITWYSVWPRAKASGIHGPGSVHFVAAHDMVKHHRVRADDLERPGRLSGSWAWFLPDRKVIESRYVARDLIHKGQPVKPEDVRLWPELAIRPGWAVVGVSLKDQPYLIELLNADSRVVICVKAKCDGTEFRVWAVVCGRAEAGTCQALLEVPADAKMFQDLASELRVIPVSSSKRP